MLTLTVGGRSAHAGDETTRAEKPLVESLQGSAKDAYTSARLLFDNNDFAGAVTKYEQAYGLSKDPRLLFDMAICQKNLRDYARMQNLLRQYVREAGNAISAEDKSAVEGALAAIKNLVATLKFAVSEAGATVVLDGDLIGVTPLGGTRSVNLGKHTIVVKKAGFDKVEKTIDVVGGSEMEVAVTLSPEVHLAHLVVATDALATIVIDNATAGKGRFDGQVYPGAHEVRVTEPGKVPYKADIDVRDGETRTLQVTLSDEAKKAIWGWIIGGAVIATGAVVGGYFLFKPKDEKLPVPQGEFGNVPFASMTRR
jgi:hypothetical protein